MVDRTAGDDGQNIVAITAGVVETLKHQHARTLRTGITVSVGGERFDSAVGRQHPTDFIETQRHSGSHQSVHATGEYHIGLAGPQCLDTLMHGDQ